MSAGYRIALARPEDIAALASIERAAGELFRGHIPDALLSETTAEGELRCAQQTGLLWVALVDDRPVGFALLEAVSDRWLHLEEMDVHPAYARRGIGTALLDAIADRARQHGYVEITLTTFRDLVWNMPFYARSGFAELAPGELRLELRNIIAAEAARGLDAHRRVAMRKKLVAFGAI